MVDPRDWGVKARRHCIYMHGDIASSRVWVHGMVIHHSEWVWVEFVFRTTSNENSKFKSGNENKLMCVGRSKKGVVNPLR